MARRGQDGPEDGEVNANRSSVRQFEAEKLLVLAATRVVGRILDEESAAVAELEEFTGKTIRFQAEEHYAQEQYDVVLL